MINDIIVVDNVFDDPEVVLGYANAEEYFTLQESGLTDTFYTGIRTSELISKDNDKYGGLLTTMIGKSLRKSFGTDGSIAYNWFGRMFFHQTFEKNSRDIRSFHTDPRHCLAGVVYLSKNPLENSGTTIIKNNGSIEIENVFNRLVLYRSDYKHAAQSGFGKDITDCRLNLTFFISDLELKIYTPEQ